MGSKDSVVKCIKKLMKENSNLKCQLSPQYLSPNLTESYNKIENNNNNQGESKFSTKIE